MNATRKSRHLLVSSFLLALCSACATVSGTLIAPDIQTPTVPVVDTLDLGTGVVPGQGADLFTDASARPPTYSTDFATAHYSGGGGLLGWLGYGLAKSVSVSGGLIGSNALIDGFWGGGKMQLLGPQGLLESNLLISGYGRLGVIGGWGKSGDNKGEFGPGGYPWSSERSGSFINAGVSVGYAITPWFMPFMGYAAGSSIMEADVKQTAANGDAGGNYHNEFRGKMTTWGGGVQLFGEKTRLSLGAQRSRTRVGGYSIQRSSVLFSLEIRIGDNRKSAPAAPIDEVALN